MIETSGHDPLRYKWTSFGPMLDEDGPFVLAADAERAIREAVEAEHKRLTSHDRHSGLACLVNYNAGRERAIRDCIQTAEVGKFLGGNVDDAIAALRALLDEANGNK